MSAPHEEAAGFTLVELVVSIVLAAIVASFIVLFLDAPIQSYFAQTRRSDLVDSANRIAAAVTSDLRTALPNSIRSPASARALEFLATQGVARYDATADSPGPDLTINGSPVSGFATLDSFETQALPYSANHLAVGNLGIPPTYDAYSTGNNVMTPVSVRIAAGANPEENQVSWSAAAAMAFKAPATPTVHSAYLVSGPVSYVCNPNQANPGAGTLMRYSGYAITAIQRVPPAARGALIARNVSACTLSVQAAPPGYAYGQLAILRVTLSSGGETLQVFLQAPTEYSQ